MSRLILLLIFGLWLSSSAATGDVSSMRTPVFSFGWTGVFFAGYLFLVFCLAIWANLLARKLDLADRHRSLRRFNWVVSGARAMVPLWLAFGLFGPADWGRVVQSVLGPLTTLNIRHPLGEPRAQLALPGLLLGTLPAMLAWVGLWWAQFPVDRVLREHNLLDQLEADMPVYEPPRVGQFILAQLRLQLLFILVPVLLILLVRDLALIGVRVAHIRLGSLSAFENLILLPSAAAVYVFAPEILRRVLRTRPLPNSPLRDRLEGICRQSGLRYRDILLWSTEYSMGNAAVMGLLPRMRYILLSDLLLETMTDQQIEAVFAHEAGHIVHHHMWWYAVFFGILTLAMFGPGKYVGDWVSARFPDQSAAYSESESSHWQDVQDGAAATGLLGLVLVSFGYLSRRCERQADVFAARMMQSSWGMDAPPPAEAGGALNYVSPSFVGERGAALFASALRRVAVVNNIPVEARSWCHGSIAKRMRYLEKLGADPSRTGSFDRYMSRLYATMVVALVACGAMTFLAVTGPNPLSAPAKATPTQSTPPPVPQAG